MKTTQIQKSNSETKTQEYIQLANQLAMDAKEVMDVTGNHIVMMIYDEIMKYYRSAENADCEYTAYVNCNAVEIWYSKIDQAF